MSIKEESKVIFLAVCTILILFGCHRIQKTSTIDTSGTAIQKNMDTITQYEELQAAIGKTSWVEGVLLMKKFVDKRGREHEIYEFWLEMNDGHLIKVRNVGEAMSKEPFTHKVRLLATVFYGNIDSDSPEVQSRVGFRLDFTEVIIIERR